LKVVRSDDPEIEQYRNRILNFVQQWDQQGAPYWLFTENGALIGVASIGKEPIMLIEPLGTPLSQLKVVDFDQPDDAILRFVSEAISISKEKKVAYSHLRVPGEKKGIASSLSGLGFKELANTYWMECKLDGNYVSTERLRLERRERPELRQYLDKTVEFMSGSPDNILELALGNIRGLPEELLDLLYNMNEYYLVFLGADNIGVLDLEAKKGYVNNIGVSPHHRGRGHGRDIMLHGLKRLQEAGCDTAGLRVHVDNLSAVNLYKSLGFEVKRQYRDLFWRPDSLRTKKAE